MTVTEIFFGLFGGALGGIIVSLIKSHLDKKNEISINLNKIIEDKYRSLLVFMACALDIKKKKYFTLNEQIPLNTKEEYLQQIKEYYYHSVLYSSDSVILALKDFINEISMENYLKVAVAMRNDLWNKGTKIKIDDLIIK